MKLIRTRDGGVQLDPVVETRSWKLRSPEAKMAALPGLAQASSLLVVGSSRCQFTVFDNGVKMHPGTATCGFHGPLGIPSQGKRQTGYPTDQNNSCHDPATK
jgi:hypothetical protein